MFDTINTAVRSVARKVVAAFLRAPWMFAAVAFVVALVIAR